MSPDNLPGTRRPTPPPDAPPLLRCVPSSDCIELSAAWSSCLVGRKDELASLAHRIEHDYEARVVLVHGPAGVGKSSLLEAGASLCDELGMPAYFCKVEVDSGEALSQLLERADDGGEDAPGRRVLLCDCDLDSNERDAALFEQILPQLRREFLVLIASRQGPSARWMLHCGWGTALKTLALGPLTRDASALLLEHRRVPRELHDDMVRFGEGNPLLLTAAASAVAADLPAGFFPDRAEDALRKLLPTLGVRATTDLELTALRCCALPLGVTPEMLSAVLGTPADGERAFAWLARQTYVDDTSQGLRMHEVIRRAVLQELRALYPAELHHLHRKLKQYCARQVGEAVEPDRWIANILFIDRQLSELQTYIAWDDSCMNTSVGTAKAADWERLHRSVLEHEGDQSARVLQHWAHAFPESIEVVRSSTREASGLLVTLPIDSSVLSQHGDRDPALQVIRDCRAEDGDEEETVGILYRYWLDLGTHQSPSPVLTRLLTHMIARSMALRDIPLTYAVVRDDQAWLRFARVLGMPAERVGSFTLDGGTFTVLAVDWHERDQLEWLTDFVERTMDEVGGQWWQRLAGQEGARPEGARLRETLRPGAPTKSQPLGTGGLGDLIMGRMRRLAKEAQLTGREIEVLDLLLLGRNTEEMALVLEISPRTAKFHQGNVLRKLGADSKSDLVRLLL